ncbi:MAG: hypothetical protein J6W00_11390, partial [Lentisphaeria bacterium]|nr:hypothetical protein [Lentisphaeria bacterium]
AGCKFVYSVDGKPQGAVEITDEHLKNAVSLSGNEAIKNGSKIEWYITDANGDRLTNNRIIENVKLADVKEFSAEYRKDQLRIDVTDFIADAGSYDAYSIKYTVKYKDENGKNCADTREVAITLNSAERYVFTLDNVGAGTVLDYQIFGKNDAGKVQLGENYSATVDADGELVVDASFISAEITNSNTLVVNLTKFFAAEVTDFDKSGVYYTFGGVEVTRDINGNYVAEISGVENGGEYKLERHVTYINGSDDVNGIEIVEKTDEDALISGYTYDAENGIFKLSGVTISNPDADTYEVDITEYMSGIAAPLNIPTVTNMISYVVKDANGLETIRNMQVVCEYDSAAEAWRIRDNNDSTDIKFDLAEDLLPGAVISSFDVNTYALSSSAGKYGYYYEELAASRKGSFADSLNYYLGTTSDNYDNFRFEGLSGYWTAKELFEGESKRDFLGVKVVVNYDVTSKNAEGKDVVHSVSRSWDYFGNLEVDAVNDFTTLILNELGFFTIDESGNKKYDESKIKSFDIELYTTLNTGTFGEPLNSLHYADNEIAKITDYYNASEAFFDFTDYIIKNGGSADKVYTLTLKDANGNIITDADDKKQQNITIEANADGKFILRVSGQSAGADYTFTLKGDDIDLTGTIDNVGGAGISDIFVEYCKDELYIDFNSYIKEFKAENISNRDVDLDNVKFIISIGGVEKYEFAINSNAVISIPVIDPAEVQEINITVKEDKVISNKNVIATVSLDNGSYVYDLTAAVNFFIRNGINDEAEYNLWLVDGNPNPLIGESPDLIIATCKGSDLMNWYQWQDVDGKINPAQWGSGVELYITTGSDENIQRSTSVYPDYQVIYDTAENGMNFSKIFNDLKDKYVTADNVENVFFLVENNSTKTSAVVSLDDIEKALPDLGNIGDVFKVSVWEKDQVLKEGDLWQVSGNDTSIVSIETALNTQHIQKTDDKIALRSDSYGIFGGDFSRGIAERLTYDTATVHYTLPGDTKNYTIWAENKLVVESDLAGIIETNTNAINFGYAIVTDKLVTQDDSRNRTVSGVSVKAQNLELKNNFRADIDNRNTSETMAIAQEYSGENVYDADGNLISFGNYEKTFRVGTSTQDTPANGTYSASTIFTYIDKDGKQAQADLSKAAKIWVYDGVLYAQGDDGKISVYGAGGDTGSQVKTLGCYEYIYSYRDNAVFDANTDYAINPSERWVYKDGGWQIDDSMSFNTRIILEAGKDYEVGELIYGDKDLGYGIPMYDYWSYTGARQIERNEYDAEGNLQKVIYVYYTEDFYGRDLLKYKTSEYISGTWITAYAHGANNASGNTIDDIGIAVSGTLTQKSGIWAGNISVETGDVYIAAHADYLAPSTEDVKRVADQADASNNKIGAYGLKVDGTADINKIDRVALDNDGTCENVEYQFPVITAVANNNKIEAYSVNDDSDVKDWSRITNSTITAAAIHAGTLKIDTVTEDATFSASATNNTLVVNLYKKDDVAGSGVKAYGIYANNATFRDFDGNIYVEWLNNSTYGSPDIATGIYVTGTLTSNCNLRGNIDVNSQALANGIYANNITVKGAIDTDIKVYDTMFPEVTGFGINVGNTITTAGFTGEVYSYIGINTDIAKSNINGDSFDIAGDIYAGIGFASISAVNLRVSGTIVSVQSIQSELNFGLNADNIVTTFYSNVANKDYVELTGTANVTGDIDLRKGINNYSINSNATFVGNILDSAGQANIVYHLDGTPADGHITHTINSYDDQTLFSTNTITLNVNYAKIGKNYQLIKYELDGSDAEKYWLNREVAIMYQGQTVTFKLSKVVEQLIPENMTGNFDTTADDVQVITIDEVLAGKGFTFPETSGIQFGIEYYLLDAQGNKTGIGGYTTTETGADGERFFTVSGVEEGQKIGYTIVSDGENHSYYIGSTTFKDANGNDVTITGTFATDTDIFSVELSGENVSLAPEVPAMRFEALAKGEEAPAKTIITKSSYDEKNDALTLSWNHQTATQYGLVEIYAYEVEYTVFDQNGDAIGSSIAARVVGDNKLTINGIDENMFVKWRIRLLGSSSASMSSGWSEPHIDKSAVKPEIADGKAVSLEYDKDNQKIILTSETASTVNYTIFDVNGQTTNLKDACMIWNEEKQEYRLVIDNVAADSEFRYQIAECQGTLEYTQIAEKEGEENKIIQEVIGWHSLYSDSYHIADLNNMTDQTLISFDYSNFSSKVIDANYNERANVGVIGSIANITFESLESAVQVRNYIIEYCPVTEQVTLEKVKESGAASIDDYIANYLDKIAANNGAEIYSKTFTGTSLDISDIQNQTYVYWRIKAVDVNGYTSDWIAGDTFRVWANAEGDKFAPKFNEVKYGVVGLGYNPAASDNFENRTQLEGYIGWTKAEDSDSGVKNYVIEFTTQSSEKIVKTIGAEYNTPAVVGSYKIDKNVYKEGDVFTVKLDGKETVNAKVSEVIDEETGEITGYILTWEKIDFKYDGKVTIYKNGNEFLANLGSGENGYTATVYDYLFDFKGLTGSSYSYTIYAVDYFGNMSAKYSGNFSVDNGNPTNLATTVRTVVADDDVTCSIYWSEAADDNELGVRYYNVRYREVGTSEWIEKKIASGNTDYIVNEGDEGFINGFKYMFSFELDSNEKKTYEYEVIAYDYFENSSTVTGKFGSVDIAPPTGFFKPDEFKSTVDAVYKTVTVEKEIVDAEGNTTTVTETITGALDYATVKLSWDGEFADQSQLRYVIEVSDDKYFKSANTYSFWTDGSEKSMTFDNSTPGRPVGIFEGMSTVYWRVTVADEYFNTSVLSTTQSFSFTDAETGNAIVTTEKPSAPYGLTIKNDEKVDGVLTGRNISLTWRSANELLGVYSYNIELVNNAGKVVGSYSTVDKSGLQSTDVNEIVTVVKTDDYSVMHIGNLNQIFAGGDKLTDGTYTVRVSAVDGNGRVSEAGETQFVQDTTAPKIAVNQIDWYLLPAGTNQTGTSVVEFMMDWTKAAKAGGSKDIVRYEVWQTTDDPAADGAKWEKIVEVEDTRYSALLPASVKDTYYYKIVAYDASGNRSSDDLWNANNVLAFTPANAKDSYNGNFAPATKLTFDKDGRSIMPEKDYELVGRGDEDCIYFTTKDNPEALTLTANQLETVYDAASGVKVEIYKGSTNLWKTYTVSGEGKVFNDLLLDANTSYYVRISSVKYDSVVAYNFVWDKAAVGVNGYKTTDNTAGNALLLKVDGKTVTDWVGYGDSVDYKKLEISGSGKYNITLSNVAKSVTLVLVERTANANGTFSEKAISTITAKDSDLNGKTISNALLDAGKEYYLKVTADNANDIGTTYDVTVEPVKPLFEKATTEDDVRSKELALLGETKSGWVGFGDATDFYRLEVGEYGGAYNFTIEHDGTESEAVKLVVYEQLTGVNKYRTVKTVTLAKNAASISTGELYLTGANGGTYYVEVTATGAAKAQNSSYKVTADGYNLPGDKDGTSLDTMNELSGSVSDCWVGVGDNADYYYINAEDIEVNGHYYTLTLDGTNGNQIKAAIGYENPKGTFVALQTVTGAANSES